MTLESRRIQSHGTIYYIDVGLSKRYSIEGLLTKIEKIKIMVLPDQEKITIEISKKQRKILDALHISA